MRQHLDNNLVFCSENNDSYFEGPCPTACICLCAAAWHILFPATHERDSSSWEQTKPIQCLKVIKLKLKAVQLLFYSETHHLDAAVEFWDRTDILHGEDLFSDWLHARLYAKNTSMLILRSMWWSWWMNELSWCYMFHIANVWYWCSICYTFSVKRHVFIW